MQTINDKHNWFLIYHDIIQSSLFHAKRFERWEQRSDISKEYLKVIDELIQCINEKHEKDFFFDRIRNGNEYLFRSIFLAEEEDDKDRMWEVSINEKEEDFYPCINE